MQITFCYQLTLECKISADFNNVNNQLILKIENSQRNPDKFKKIKKKIKKNSKKNSKGIQIKQVLQYSSIIQKCQEFSSTKNLKLILKYKYRTWSSKSFSSLFPQTWKNSLAWMYLPSVSVKNCLMQVTQPLYSEGNDIK